VSELSRIQRSDSGLLLVPYLKDAEWEAEVIDPGLDIN
jgi:hypothetical protein